MAARSKRPAPVLATSGKNRYADAAMKPEQLLTEEEVAEARQRRLVAAHLQEIEGSPPTAEETAMFEMFERERWSHDRRLAYILQQAKEAAAVQAAE